MTYEIGKVKVTTEISSDGELKLFKDDKHIALFKMGNFKVNPYSNSKGKVLGVVITTSEQHIGKYYYFVNESTYGFRKSKQSIFELLSVLKKDYKDFGAKLN